MMEVLEMDTFTAEVVLNDGSVVSVPNATSCKIVGEKARTLKVTTKEQENVLFNFDHVLYISYADQHVVRIYSKG